MNQAGNWKQLAQLESAENDQAEFHKNMTHLGYLAAFHRLAGNTKEFEEAVAAIKKLADKLPDASWHCAQALMINDRFQDAIRLISKPDNTAAVNPLGRRDSGVAFDLLCCQFRFREALALEGIADPRGSYSARFAEQKTDDRPWDERERLRKRFASSLRMARVLCELGEKEKAVDLFSQLAKAANQSQHLRIRLVYETECRLHLEEEAFRHAADDLAQRPSRSVFRALFAKWEHAAEVWWKFLRGKYPDDKHFQEQLDRFR